MEGKNAEAEPSTAKTTAHLSVLPSRPHAEERVRPDCEQVPQGRRSRPALRSVRGSLTSHLRSLTSYQRSFSGLRSRARSLSRSRRRRGRRGRGIRRRCSTRSGSDPARHQWCPGLAARTRALTRDIRDACDKVGRPRQSLHGPGTAAGRGSAGDDSDNGASVHDAAHGDIAARQHAQRRAALDQPPLPGPCLSPPFALARGAVHIAHFDTRS